MTALDIIPVTSVRAIGDRLWLRFRDGVEGAINLADALAAAPFAELRDPDYFARVELAGGGIGWPNGYDCAPEWLYSRLVAGIGADPRRSSDDWDELQRHARAMPEISRFFGIVVRMFFSDNARPHFHAQYGEHVIAVEIEGDGIRGSFPPARLPMLFEWRDRHRAELVANWDRLRRGEPAQPIPPLG